MARHVHPWRTAYRMASRMARRAYLGGRPPPLRAGTRGSRTAHSASVIRAGNSVAVDIRVLLMPPKVTLTDQRIQGYFPNRHSARCIPPQLGLDFTVRFLFFGLFRILQLPVNEAD